MTSFAPTATDFGYISTDIPADVTLDEWRRRLAAQNTKRSARRAAKRFISRRVSALV
jgi:hypothetical protein